MQKKMLSGKKLVQISKTKNENLWRHGHVICLFFSWVDKRLIPLEEMKKEEILDTNGLGTGVNPSLKHNNLTQIVHCTVRYSQHFRCRLMVTQLWSTTVATWHPNVCCHNLSPPLCKSKPDNRVPKYIIYMIKVQYARFLQLIANYRGGWIVRTVFWKM